VLSLRKSDPFPHSLDEGKSWWKNHACAYSIAELQKEYKKVKVNDGHIKMLLDATFQRRRDWVQTLAEGQIKPILDVFPCFEYGSFVSMS